MATATDIIKKKGKAVSATSTAKISDILAKAKVVTPPKEKAPTVGESIFNMDTLKGKTSFPALQGGGETVVPNVMRTFGNIPSSGAKLVRGVASPVNPLDVDSSLNIGSNVVKSANVATDIFKDRGLVQGTKDIASGFGTTIKKIFEAPGKAYVNYLDKTGYLDDPSAKNLFKTVVEKPAEAIATVGIEDPLLIPSLLYGGPKAKGAKGDRISDLSRPVLDPIKKAKATIVETLTTRAEKKIESAIVQKYEKGVKPLLPGKTTPTKMTQYKDDVLNATKIINENKANLKFADSSGEIISGKNPQSLQQFSESIEQTKKTIFAKYDALAKEAGDAGVKIKLQPIADELDVVINNKALGITNPRAQKYAQQLKDRLNKAGDLDAETAQDVIQNYNKSLEAFYRNPTYDTASQAAVDAMVANRMREVLDKNITNVTGKQYQALKSQYGSLKAIERDVIKATLRDARKNTKGLIDFTDIFSGGQIVNGLITLNPGTLAQGLTARAIKEFYKFLNNPNRAIQKMFQNVENIKPKVPKPVKVSSNLEGKRGFANFGEMFFGRGKNSPKF